MHLISIISILTRRLHLLICMASPLLGHSQDISNSNLTWTVNKSHDLTAREDYDYQCTFKTNGQGQIIWSQNHGEFVSTIEINHINGSWANVSTPGSVTYQITVSGVNGHLTFTRDGTGVFILLNLEGDPDPFNQKYEVISIQNN